MRGSLYKTSNGLSLDNIILYYGTNNSLRNRESIAGNYITLTKKAKAETNLVSVSQIILSNDKFNLQDTEVNNFF